MPYVGPPRLRSQGRHARGRGAQGARLLRARQPRLVGNERRFLASEVGGRSVSWTDCARSSRKPPRIPPRWRRRSAGSRKWRARATSTKEPRRASTYSCARLRARYGRSSSWAATARPGSIPRRTTRACARMRWSSWRWTASGRYPAAEGNGPVHALDLALRKALVGFYPSLAEMRLTDYKVRVLDSAGATAAAVRVLIESADSRGGVDDGGRLHGHHRGKLDSLGRLHRIQADEGQDVHNRSKTRSRRCR